MSSSADPSRRPIVWIVDDSPTERAISQRALNGDYTFEHFGDGAEVLERLAHDRPDVILLDWVMPGVTGDQVVRFVRAQPTLADVPIIMVTASRIETDDVVHGLAVGANDYVARPFAPEELRARVDAVLRAKQLADTALRERARLATVNRLGRALFQAGHDVDAILNVLVEELAGGLCDGCSVLLLPGAYPSTSAARHRAESRAAGLAAISTLADPTVWQFASDDEATARLPPAYHAYIAEFGLRGLAILPFPTLAPIQGVVTATRDGGSPPFAEEDLHTVATCIEYASLAVQNALRFYAERDLATERERVAQFHAQMLGIVSHDLRSPLGALSVGLERVERLAAGVTELGSTLERMRRSTDRMGAIIEQVLDVTRARLGGGIPVSRAETSLAAIARRVVEEIAMGHPRALVELIAPDPVVGYWDAERLSQVVSNLISNAIQYGHPERPIVVEVRGPSPRRAVLTVTNAVRDQPIDPARLAGIFDPYARGGERDRHARGLGLGLYIVAEIVRAHDGTIRAGSSPDGTVFTVELPRLAAS